MEVKPPNFNPLVVSIIIELIQLKIGRAFDVDDIILNIVGGILGYYLYRIVDKIFRKSSENFKGAIVIVALLTALVFIALIFV